MHSASSRKHQAWNEWIFCFFGWSKTFGEMLEMSMFDSFTFITVCFFPIFAESDDSTNHYKACLVSCLWPMVCGNRIPALSLEC